MLSAYANAVPNQTPVAKHLGEAVDQVRRAEITAVQAEHDDRIKGARQFWPLNKANLSPAQRCRLATIRQNGEKTARAWAIKEDVRWFWQRVYAMSAAEFCNRRYAWGVRCRLRPVVKVARMLKGHLPSLLSYFHRRITNATSEAFNSGIQALKYAGRV